MSGSTLAGLAEAVAAARAAEAELDAALAGDVDPDGPEAARAADADRRARDRVAAVLADLGRAPDDTMGEAAVILADGTVVCRAVECDGLAIVPPDRVFRGSAPAAPAPGVSILVPGPYGPLAAIDPAEVARDFGLGEYPILGPAGGVLGILRVTGPGRWEAAAPDGSALDLGASGA